MSSRRVMVVLPVLALVLGACSGSTTTPTVPVASTAGPSVVPATAAPTAAPTLPPTPSPTTAPAASQTPTPAASSGPPSTSSKTPARPSETAIAVAAGGDHTCAITLRNGLRCWGSNNAGQLGNASTIGSPVPVDVLGLMAGAIAVVAGPDHNCALTEAGSVKCWGANCCGELGDGTTTDRSTPVDVIGLSRCVIALAVGLGYHCALMTTGSVKCWGYNQYGQLGDGSTTERDTPVDVIGLSGVVTAIAGGGNSNFGGNHTCALTRAGAVTCWGANDQGELGNGTTVDSTTPVAVSGMSKGMIAITGGGDHTCALSSGGAVRCWGSNNAGQLGDGSTRDATKPVNVTGLTWGVVAIAAGLDQTCALTSAGGVKCWGYNGSGQLGDGSNAKSSVPVGVTGLAGRATSISVGYDHACAIVAPGFVSCWGYNGNGQLGDGSTTVV